MRMEDPSPEPQHEQRSSWQYFLGLGIGLVPLILALISIGSLASGNSNNGNVFLFDKLLETALTGLTVALFLYIGLFIASIVCLAIKRIRFVGYGLLTMVIASPVIMFIGCLVVIYVPHG